MNPFGVWWHLKGMKRIKNILIIVFTAIMIAGAGMSKERGYQKATFAGGCFWCMEPPFEGLEGVKEVIPGYTGGIKTSPTYAEVSSGRTGHYEAIQIVFDPSKVSYEKLLEIFWMQIDPTDSGGQFADRGSQYKFSCFVPFKCSKDGG